MFSFCVCPQRDYNLSKEYKIPRGRKCVFHNAQGEKLDFTEITGSVTLKDLDVFCHLKLDHLEKSLEGESDQKIKTK